MALRKHTLMSSKSTFISEKRHLIISNKVFLMQLMSIYFYVIVLLK